MRAFLTKHALPVYFLLTFAISWGGILLVVGGPSGFTGTTARDDPRFPLVYLAMLAGPVISSLLLTGVVDGREGFRRMGSRLVAWRLGLRGYAITLFTAPLVIAAALFVLSVQSPGFRPGLFTHSDPASIVAFALVVGLGAGFFEELGWTGFAIPRLLKNHSPLATGLIVGVFWAVWHVVALLWGIGNTAKPVPLAVFIPLDLISILPVYRVLMVRIYSRNNSLLGSMLMHASLTTTLLALAPSAASGIDALLIDLLVAAALWCAVLLTLPLRGRVRRVTAA